MLPTVKELAKIFVLLALGALLTLLLLDVYVYRNTPRDIVDELHWFLEQQNEGLQGVYGQTQNTLAGGQTLLTHATQTVDGATHLTSTLSAGARTTFANVNRPCPGPKDKAVACGTLADVNRTLATYRGTAGVMEKALIHENANLDRLDAQEQQAFNHLDATVSSMNTAVGNLNTLATDPDLHRIIHASASSIEHADGILADGQYEIHTLVHPKPPATKLGKIKAGIEGTGDVARHWFPALF